MQYFSNIQREGELNSDETEPFNNNFSNDIEDNSNKIDSKEDDEYLVSNSVGYLGGLKYSELLKGKKNRWKVLLDEVKKLDPRNPVVKAIIRTLLCGFEIPSRLIYMIKPGWEKKVFRVINSWGKELIKIAKINLEIIGNFDIPKDKPLVFVSNHTSPYDIPVIYGTLPVLAGFVANKELATMPVMNYWMKQAHSIFVDVKDTKSKISTLKKIVQNLNNMQHVIIFPEGKMSPDGNLQDFQRGGLQAAVIANACIVPIALNGVREVLPPGDFAINPDKKVIINIGSTIFIDKLDNSGRKRIDQIMHDSLSVLLENARKI